MARIRHLKPEFFTDRKLASCGHQAMLLFAGLWCLADRDGRLIDAPNFIAGQIFPYDSSVNCDETLATLAATGLITRYQVSTEKYLQICNFTKHQRPNIKETQSIIPECSARSKKSLRQCPTLSKTVPDTASEGDSNSNSNSNREGDSVLSPTGDHRPFVEFWMDQYQSRTGVKYIFNGAKDGKLVKNILQKLQRLDTAKMFVVEYFQSTDEFNVERAGFSIGVFSTQLNRIAQKLSTTRVEGESELDRFNRIESEKYLKQFDAEGNRRVVAKG